MNGLGQFINLLLATNTDAFTTGLNNVTYVKVHLLGLQLQVTTEVLVHLLHHTSPLGVAGIGLALVHKNTFDNTVLLGLLGQRYQALVGVVVVGSQHTLHPAGSLLFSVILDTVGQETLDVDTAYGHVDNTDFDILRQRGYEGTAEPVCRGQTRVGTAEGCRGFTPLTHLAVFPVAGWSGTGLFGANHRMLGIRGTRINGGHQQETRTGTSQVNSLRTSVTLHIRLSETEKDVKVRVSGLGGLLSLGLLLGSFLLGCHRAWQGE